MSDLGLLNFGNEELDYDENEIENLPDEKSEEIRNGADEIEKHSDTDEGECDSDDGEIKSDTEDGEISGSDSEGEVIEPEDAPKVDLFPDVKPKQPPPPQPEMTPQQQARSTIPCRYYRQGYCQFGQKCHFMHDRPGMQIINPAKAPEPDKGSYELFPQENHKIRNHHHHPHQHRPPHDLMGRMGRPPIHYPPTREDNSWAQGIGKANEFRRRKPGELDPNDARRKLNKNSSRSPEQPVKKRKLELKRVSRDSTDSDRKSRSRSKTKDRWDLHRDYETSLKPRGGKRKRSASSTSSSTSSSESESSSESSGRATPKGYRHNRNGAKTSSEDEAYRREKRLQDKAKKYSSKKSSHSSRSSRSSSHRNRSKRENLKSKKRSSKKETSSSSSSSSDSESSTASSSSEKKLQKRLKEVERVLKEKKKTEKRKSRKNSHKI